MYGLVNFSEINTQPGADNAFAPPVGFDGDYVSFMYERIQSDCGVKQHVACVARRFRGSTVPVFAGPYAKQAERLARRALAQLVAASDAAKAAAEQAQ